MTCPECKCEETTKDSQGTYCKKCGMETDDVKVYTGGHVSRAEKLELTLLPQLEFIINPKKELFAFKVGLKNNKLVKNWQNIFGFKLSTDLLPPGLNDKVTEHIKTAFKNNQKELIESHSRFENNWKKVNSKFLAEIENIMDFKWDIYKFKCYISLVSKGGIHNSSKNFIVVNYRWKENSNYIIAHELFHIIFRNYITRFFKEKYDNFDEDLSEIIVNFIMLDHEKTKLLFPNIKFSIGIFPKKLQENAKKIYPLWKSSPSFKEFMIESYKKLGIEKTWVSY